MQSQNHQSDDLNLSQNPQPNNVQSTVDASAQSQHQIAPDVSQQIAEVVAGLPLDFQNRLLETVNEISKMSPQMQAQYSILGILPGMSPKLIIYNDNNIPVMISMPPVIGSTLAHLLYKVPKKVEFNDDRVNAYYKNLSYHLQRMPNKLKEADEIVKMKLKIQQLEEQVGRLQQSGPSQDVSSFPVQPSVQQGQMNQNQSNVNQQSFFGHGNASNQANQSNQVNQNNRAQLHARLVNR
jgi:hypothetical protein